MDRAKVKAITDDIMKAIEVLEKKHNISIQRGSASYSDNALKLTVKVLENGVRRDTGVFAIDCINMEFTGSDGVDYIVVEYKTRSRNMPVIIKDKKTGKLYKVSELYVKSSVKWVDKY